MPRSFATKTCAQCGVQFEGRSAAKFCGTRCQVLASSAVNEQGCWIWTKALSSDGYGRAWMPSQNATKPAMRLSYEAFKGPIEEGMCVCHSCDVRACVNPEHLWLGTIQDNNEDMIAKKRHARGERGKAKLTESDVRLIRADPRGCDLLAREFGVNPSCIVKIRANLIWRHVA